MGLSIVLSGFNQSEKTRNYKGLGQNTERHSAVAFPRNYARMSAALPRMLRVRTGTSGGQRSDASRPGRSQRTGAGGPRSEHRRHTETPASVPGGWRSS